METPAAPMDKLCVPYIVAIVIDSALDAATDDVVNTRLLPIESGLMLSKTTLCGCPTC